MDNKIIAKNPTAYHNYTIIDKIEAGIVLYGTEIKSIRQGKVNLKDSYAVIEKNGEVFVYSMNISNYEQGNIYNKDPMRPKKLLLHKKEIMKIEGQLKTKGYTLVPLKMYFNNRGKLKVLLGIGYGKNKVDKRETIKNRDINRDIQREFSAKLRG